MKPPTIQRLALYGAMSVSNPTELRIRIPNRDFHEIANECIANNSFDEAIRRIQSKLVDSSRTKSKRDTKYWTDAFRTFLIANGGHAKISAPT